MKTLLALVLLMATAASIVHAEEEQDLKEAHEERQAYICRRCCDIFIRQSYYCRNTRMQCDCPNQSCPASLCGNGGRCKTWCSYSEEEVPGLCSYTGRSGLCRCCKRKPPACSSPNSSCGSGGRCKPICSSSETVISGHCSGASCKCCKPKPPACTSPNSSCGSGGKCKPTCSSSEKVISGQCSGIACKCCKPKCPTYGSSCGIKGTWKNMCSSSEVLGDESPADFWCSSSRYCCCKPKTSDPKPCSGSCVSTCSSPYGHPIPGSCSSGRVCCLVDRYCRGPNGQLELCP